MCERLPEESSWTSQPQVAAHLRQMTSQYRAADRAECRSFLCNRSLFPMMCSFCGTVNHPENRFCGMCGVRFERRKTERRVPETSGQVCPSCGHSNQAGHKFCGLCGSRVDRREQDRRMVASVAKKRATAVANAQLPAPEGSGITPVVSRQPVSRGAVQTTYPIAPVRPRPALSAACSTLA